MIHVRKASVTGSEIATVLDDSVVANMWNPGDTHSHVNNIVVTPLNGSSNSFTFPTGEPSKWTGGQTTQSIAPQVCALVKLTTDVRGRSYRGRVYVPWVSEASTTNGFLDSDTVTAMQTAWETFQANLATNDTELVVASYLHSTAQEVTALLVESFTATQRKRQKRTSI